MCPMWLGRGMVLWGSSHGQQFGVRALKEVILLWSRAQSPGDRTACRGAPSRQDVRRVQQRGRATVVLAGRTLHLSHPFSLLIVVADVTRCIAWPTGTQRASHIAPTTSAFPCFMGMVIDFQRTLPSVSLHEQDLQIVHVRPGRASDDSVPSLAQQAINIMSPEGRRRIQTLGERCRSRRAIDHTSGTIGGAI